MDDAAASARPSLALLEALPEDVHVLLSRLLLPPELARLGAASRALARACGASLVWAAQARAWGHAAPLPHPLSSPPGVLKRWFGGALFARRAARLRGAVSVYNADYLAVVEGAVFTAAALTLTVFVRGGGALGALQQPHGSSLAWLPGGGEARQPARVDVIAAAAGPPGQRDFIECQLVFDLRGQAAAGRACVFTYGNTPHSGYAPVELFALTPDFVAAHRLQHLGYCGGEGRLAGNAAK
jgi:hypothetical protein